MRRFTIYTSPAFIGALLVLLINDGYLKWHFTGWVTGKLSDFAGLLLASMLLGPVFPRHTGKAIVTLALAFVVWKSPMSQQLIDFWNALGLFTIGRVSDYGDLCALVMLPLGAALYHRHLDHLGEVRAVQRLLFWPVLLTTVSAISATSAFPYTRAFAIRGSDADTVISLETADEIIGSVIGPEGYECEIRDDSSRLCEHNGFYVRYGVENGELSTQITGPLGGIFTLGAHTPVRKTHRVDELVDELKATFTLSTTGLEYVEKL